jgi:toxin-antitoxin system PIN domain toxin
VILPDVNVLIYAYYGPAPEHSVYARWLNDVRSTGSELLLPTTVLTGFLRIVTNSRVIENAPSTAEAMSFVVALRSGAGAREVTDESAVWRRLGELVDGDQQIRGNLVPDAFLAAIAISHGATVATRDRGYARFPRLRWFDPAVG